MFASRIEDHLELGIVFNAMYPDAVRNESLLLQSADRVLHDVYFRRIEISGIRNAELKETFKQRLRVCRVNNSYLAQPTIFAEQLDLGSPDRSLRSKAIQRMADCLSEAEEICADGMEIISGPDVDKNRLEAIEWLADSILTVNEEAKSRRIKLLVEMFDRDVDKKRLIGSVDDTVRLFEKIGSDQNVRLLLDLSHIPMVRADIADAVLRLRPWIGHVHVGSTVMQPNDSKYGDSHPSFGYPAGAIDVEQLATFFKLLGQAEYIHPARSSAVSFELICSPSERQEDLLANAKRTLQLAWRQFLREGGGSESWDDRY
ncbi:sugar phosphate isomerase/epimerase family protein [Cohnella thailandensis]|uniref:TIM barrel protein n=1 Tax=Cohnella thailandensis TaxID=557557 RepID=A0A841T376_9BACL|nr:TIM barrel protein [Cohnella thailandensis]MBB6637316.1 TIM barrel protein [Cohnella thailandensis]MBP1976644.1 sugar phosphate isomerase/epimerase [Cohnella thailandensis]